MKICYSCFKEFVGGYHVCPHCGHEEIIAPKEPIYLYPGTVLRNKKGRQYIIGEAIGAGGFGTVYKAFDTTLETVIAVKEFFISRLMTRTPGQEEVLVYRKASEEYNYRKNRFLAEARAMASCSGSQNIPAVFDYFEENNTAYIVMEYLDGIALNNYLKKKGKIGNPAAAVKIASDIGFALETLHSKKIIHRDVAPDNIYICRGKPNVIKLLDLGAAKLQDETDEVIDIVLKPGYSPPEQYEENGKIGPWSDVYALGATLYMMLTGIKPEESTNRKIEDRLLPPNAIDTTISENLSNAVMKAMAVDRHMRFKTIGEFIRAINGEKKIIPLVKERKRKTAKRVLSVLAACLLVVAFTASVTTIFDAKRGRLPKETIVIWYVSGNNQGDIVKNDDPLIKLKKQFEDNQNREKNDSHIEEGTFKNDHKELRIETKTFADSEDLLAELNNTNKKDLPDLFCCAGARGDGFKNLNLMSFSDKELTILFKGSNLLREYYHEYYGDDQRRIPIEFMFPVAFYKGETNEYCFSNLDALVSQNSKVGRSKDFRAYLESFFDERTENGRYVGRTAFEENKTDVFLTASNLYDKYTDTTPLAELYTMNFNLLIYQRENGKIPISFTNEWSIIDHTEEDDKHRDGRKKVAIAFLEKLLDEDYQKSLTMPVNENVLMGPNGKLASFCQILNGEYKTNSANAIEESFEIYKYQGE